MDDIRKESREPEKGNLKSDEADSDWYVDISSNHAINEIGSVSDMDITLNKVTKQTRLNVHSWPDPDRTLKSTNNHNNNVNNSKKGTASTYHSQSGYARLVIKEIQSIILKQKDIKRHKTRFFQIVSGGNVKFIKEVVTRLQRNFMVKELEWIFGKSPLVSDTDLSKPVMEPISCCKMMINCLIFIPVFITYLALIPVFSIWHSVIYNAYLTFRRSSIKEVELPLVFALLSEDTEIVKLFLDHGSCIYMQDRVGNNVYHYLADLSAENPEKAIRCHRTLCSCFNDVTKLREVIMLQQNYLGLTGFEAIAKYGSLQFFRIISHDESCIGKRLLSVSKDEIWADTSQNEYHINMRDSHKPQYRRVPLNNPDSEDIDSQKGHFSSIECIDKHAPINNEHVDESPLSASNIHNETTVSTYTSMSNSINLNILEFDVSMYENGDVFGRQSFPLQLIAGRGVDIMSETDVTSALQSKLVDKWMSTKYKQYAPFCVLGHALYFSVTAMLLYYIVYNDGYPYPYRLLPPYLDFYKDEVSGAIHCNFTNMTESTVNYTSYEAMEPQDTATCLDVSVFIDGDNEPFQACQVTALKKIQNACEVLTMDEVLEDIFQMDAEKAAEHKQMNRYLWYSIAAILGSISLLNIILKISFLITNYNFRAHSPLGTMIPVIARRISGSYTDRQLVVFMCTFFAAYLYAQDLLEKTLPIIDRISADMGNSSTWIHNKSAAKDLPRQLGEAVIQQNYFESVSTTILIVCLLIQFLHAIHSLRLLPGIGFFVITTKKMAKHLVQFAVIFIIVSLAFATIFHFVMRKPDCLALRVEGFGGLPQSLFSTYQLALGQGEHEFTINFNAKMAYTTYTVITILLLLNLIIAVMTTTAQGLSRSPWKHALCRFEMWDEILGTESHVLLVTTLFRKLRNLWKRVFYNAYIEADSKHNSFEIIYMLR